jgi:subtilisin family serine protease
MTVRSRAAAAAAGALVAGMLGSLVSAGPAGADGVRHEDRAAVADPGQAPRWDEPGPSLTVAPRRLAADVGPGERARVVSVRSVDGRPVVRVVPVTGRSAALEAVADLQQHPDPVSVALDTRDRPAGSDPSVAAAAPLSNDPAVVHQWWLTRMRAPALWSAAPSGGATVAVVDSGVEATHEDLAGAVLPGTDLVDTSGDGSLDEHGHGTHVAGIVGALTGNAIGVASLAPGTKILPVRVLDADGAGWDSDVAAGIVYAVDHGAEVVNLSLGGPASGPSADAVRYAVEHDVLVVAAAGNGRTTGNPVSYPAAYPDVLAVAASDTEDRTAAFSSTGPYVDITAPGDMIASTYPEPTGYVFLSGTSMASPVVAAAAAVVRAARPDLTAAEVAALLQSTATDLAAPGRDDESGTGLVDPVGALCSVVTCPGAPDPDPAPSTDPDPSPATPSQTPAPPVVSAPPPVDTAAPVRHASALQLLSGPATRPYGTTETAAARLVDTTTGAALPGRAVRLCVQVAPETFTRCVERTTDSNGEVRHSVVLRAHTTLTLGFPGEAGLSPSTSSPLRLRVTSRARVSRSGDAVSVRVAPASGTRVTLQRRAGSAWRAVTARRTDRVGSARFAGLRPGAYRVLVRATPALSATVSRTVRIR